MKKSKRLSTSFLLLFSSFIFFSCSSDDNNNNPNPDPEEPTGQCYVQLFDGDDFSDDNIIIDEPGEYSNLENLPGSIKDWNDEADSFKSGDSTTVTMWAQINFQGDSIVYEGGAAEGSIDEPSSMKITCGDDDGDGDGNGDDNPGEPSADCYVQLFDGDNYTDDTITVDGPGEFENLDNLPGSDKNWDDEADSFKVGESTSVTMWTERNFEGDSIVYDGGAQEPSADEPRSMKIRCIED